MRLPVGQCVRLHRFAIDGMADNAAMSAKLRMLYYPYVEPFAGAGKGLLEALAAGAFVVVTDEFPCELRKYRAKVFGEELPCKIFHRPPPVVTVIPP